MLMIIPIQQIHPCRQAGAADRRLLWLVTGVALVLILVVFLLYPRPVSDPGLTHLPAVVAPTTKEERGDQARDIIADLKKTVTPPATEEILTADQSPVEDPSRAQDTEMDNLESYTRAQAFQEDGKLADAQLLYFFAARGGYAPAAFDLASFYDPNHFSQESNLMDKPDPFQAYKWYKQSLALGHATAASRLTALHAWVEAAADQGDTEAERLLFLWE